MSYWAVDIRNLAGKEFVITKSHRYANISKHDRVVFFSREHSKVEFVSYADVITVDHQTRGKYEEEERYYTIAGISGSNSLENPLSAEDLAYSLEKVYRYKMPFRHFCRQYVWLSKPDFETITHGWIYWARTAFGIFINALQTDQINRFIQEVAQTNPEILISYPNYGPAWVALREFIQNEFVNTAELFRAIHNDVDVLKNKFSVDIEFEKIGLSTDDNTKSDLLNDQEAFLSHFVSSLNLEKENIFDILSRNITQSETESRFEKIFGGTSWLLHAIRH
ncbi:MAG: hypothetical protein JW967_03800 [Dehalococcoidales bacterium]|nr:hypothetical protein [Dehalococcoidales bacterium]